MAFTLSRPGLYNVEQQLEMPNRENTIGNEAFMRTAVGITMSIKLSLIRGSPRRIRLSCAITYCNEEILENS